MSRSERETGLQVATLCDQRGGEDEKERERERVRRSWRRNVTGEGRGARGMNRGGRVCTACARRI